MEIQIFPLDFKGEQRIGIKPMSYNGDFPQMIKKIKGSFWTPDVKSWHIPYDKMAFAQLKRLFGSDHITVLIVRPLPHSQTRKITKVVSIKYIDQLERLEERLRLQRYSMNTVKTYKSFFLQFLAQGGGSLALPELWKRFSNVEQAKKISNIPRIYRLT